jgi:hypothetical protein
MKNAILYIGDGATMSTECSLLGVPSIYVSPLSGGIGNHLDLHRYGLLYSFKTLPHFDFLYGLLSTPKSVWVERRDLMLKEKIDVTDYMINYFEAL